LRVSLAILRIRYKLEYLKNITKSIKKLEAQEKVNPEEISYWRTYMNKLYSYIQFTYD